MSKCSLIQENSITLRQAQSDNKSKCQAEPFEASYIDTSTIPTAIGIEK